MFTAAQLLHKWNEQQPSNQGDSDSVEVGRVYYMGMDLLLILFLCHNEGCIINYTPYRNSNFNTENVLQIKISLLTKFQLQQHTD